MKRIAAWMIVLLMLFVGIPCSAAGGFYCEYTPKSEKSTVFYIDLCSSEEVSAAILELRFDEKLAEYREASAVEKTSTVRAACDNACVRIAFADSGSVKGKLCRVAFKALQAGTCTFTLHISQAADSAPNLMTDLPDSSIEVKLGKDDVVTSASSKSAKTSSKSSGKSNTSSRSTISGVSDDDAGNSNVPIGGVYDLRKLQVWPYIVVGVLSTLLILGLVLLGVMLGRRKSAKKSPDNENEKEKADAENRL
ncbi:MAG: hypothetical protein IJI50_05330 [Ruminococcus sp.]|nr:hypothetical protein [Ruminococcus sp.]